MVDGDFVKPDQALGLGHSHADELGVHAFDVSQYEELLNAGIFTHVARQFGVGVTPLLGGLAKQGDVEKISLACIGKAGLFGRDGCGNDM